ncbi:MAG: gamma-glutamyltransferase [FCB group bacterium]|nr:gamma-glutamyltransferase [FCB group bacterium]
MVVSGNRWASEAGIEILKKGGNAVDAAAAIGFALAVTYPQAGNIGGGGFMVAYTAEGKPFTLDFREKAPEAAYRDMYLDENGNVIENLSLYSPLAVGVPGSVDGLLKAWRDYGSGKISRREILAPAIRLAARGFPITHRFAELLNDRREFFERDDGARSIFIRPDGRPWKAGDRLVQKDLARTLKRISRLGRDGFYTGKIAQLIEKEMREGNGLITTRDLARYESKYRPPVTGTFRDLEILSMGPPSSGGALLVQMLNMLEYFELDTLGWNSADYIHLLTEVERRAYADRAEHMGDPDYWDVPLEMLTSKTYAKNRVQNISFSRATPSSEIFAGDPTAYEGRETTHYSVADQFGNAVSVTTTLNTSFGCGIVVEGAGFFLNNEMDDFSAKPGIPNVFGLVGKEANAIQPGKRPLSSMSPTIVLKNGAPFMIIGSPGGATIITTVLQCILNVEIHQMNIQEAVAAPRVHSQWLPDVIMTEPRSISRDSERILNNRGHITVPYRWGYIGQANGILIGEDGFYGGADPRGENVAAGY